MPGKGMAATTAYGGLASELLAVLNERIGAGLEVGMQVAAYHEGGLIVDVAAGTRSEEGDKVDGSTLFQIFSVFKGVLAVAVHIQAERRLLDIDGPIADYWPEFARHGKSGITLRHVLTHSAGIPQMPPEMNIAKLADWSGMAAAIADLAPIHAPGERSYYHGMTYGWLLGEAVRRTDPQQRAIDIFIAEEISRPLSLDGLFMRMTDDLRPRLATLSGSPYPTDLPADSPLMIGIPAAVALQPPIFNRADVQSSLVPAVSCFANARSIGKVFAMLAEGGEIDGARLLSSTCIETLSEPRPNSDAPDPFLGGPARLSIGGFMLGGGKPAVGPHEDTLFSIGAGGSIAWADRRNRLAVAITHNRLYGHQPSVSDPQVRIGDIIRRHLDIV